MARPSKLNTEIQERICQAVRAGNTFEVAAQIAGITERTLYAWLALGRREARGRHRAFADAVELASTECEAVLVTRIAKAANDGSWGAAAWLLERRFPQRWAKQPVGGGEKQKDEHAPTGKLVRLWAE